ncbi:DUF317 domain-containing protein [Streptomyces sp. NPDC003444]
MLVRPSRPQAGGCGRPPATPSSTRAPTGCAAPSGRAPPAPSSLGDLPVAWQVSARPHPTSALTEWNAYFTAGLPHEALTDFFLALGARTELAFSFGGPEAVVAAVCAQGWARDIDRPCTAALVPGLSVGVSSEEVPPLVRDADPRARTVRLAGVGRARRRGSIPVVCRLQQQRAA